MRRIIGLLTALTLILLVGTTAMATLPPGGTFLDDDCCEHEGHIEALAAAGLTDGCSVDPSLYCPLEPVTRAEMAAFVLRSTGLLDDSLPHRGMFGDVPAGAWFAPAAEQATELGIMSGFDGGLFRPDSSTTRFEVAVYLVRALEGETELEPATGRFADVPASVWYAPHVERLAALGITAGCSADGTLFCPTSHVTRAQMASFLARALGLDPITPPPRPVTTTTMAETTTSTGSGTSTTTTTVPATTTTTCPPEVDT